MTTTSAFTSSSPLPLPPRDLSAKTRGGFTATIRAMVVRRKKNKRRDHEQTRRDVLRTSRSPCSFSSSSSRENRYENREGKETEREHMSITPFPGSRGGGFSNKIFEIELPARDIGIEFREVKGAPFAAMVSKVARTSRAFGKVEEGDVLTRVTATQIHEKVPETQATTIFDPWKYKSGWFECKDESFDDVLAAIRSTAVVSAGYVHKLVTFEFLRTVESNDDDDDEEEEEEEGAAASKAEGEARMGKVTTSRAADATTTATTHEKEKKTYLETLSQRGKLEADREAKRADFPREKIEGGYAEDEDSEKLFREDPRPWDD